MTPFLCFVVIRQTSTSANKKSRQRAVRKVQPIVGIFAERKYLLPSDNKMVCGFVGSFGISLEFEMLIYTKVTRWTLLAPFAL